MFELKNDIFYFISGRGGTADALDLGSGGATRDGSGPFPASWHGGCYYSI